MCGLVGFSGKTDYDIEKIKILLLYNETRGGDGTGYYNGKILSKKADTTYTFLGTNNIEKSSFFIGHCRKGTNGMKNDKNCHPFKFDNIIGAHNGVIKEAMQLGLKYDIKGNEWDVDSEIFFNYMSKQDNYDILKTYNGAAALLFTKGKDRLFVYRDEERPLFYGQCKEGIYFSSLENSLKAINCEDIGEIAPYKLQTYHNGKLETTLDIERPKAREATKNYGHYGFYDNGKALSNPYVGLKVRGVYGFYTNINYLTRAIIEEITYDYHIRTKVDKVIIKVIEGNETGSRLIIDDLRALQKIEEDSSNINSNFPAIRRNELFQDNSNSNNNVTNKKYKHLTPTETEKKTFETLHEVREKLIDLSEELEALVYLNTEEKRKSLVTLSEKLIKEIEVKTLNIFSIDGKV